MSDEAYRDTVINEQWTIMHCVEALAIECRELRAEIALLRDQKADKTYIPLHVTSHNPNDMYGPIKR